MSAKEVSGSSKVLNKTITESMRFLRDNAKRPGNVKLRVLLSTKLADLSVHWYRRGVRRGRMESYNEWASTGRLSKQFRFKATREFFHGEERVTRITASRD